VSFCFRKPSNSGCTDSLGDLIVLVEDACPSSRVFNAAFEEESIIQLADDVTVEKSSQLIISHM
jgi:hypothetical protein